MKLHSKLALASSITLLISGIVFAVQPVEKKPKETPRDSGSNTSNGDSFDNSGTPSDTPTPSWTPQPEPKHEKKPKKGDGVVTIEAEPAVNLQVFHGQGATEPVSEEEEETVGAFTVANWNDTNGNGNNDPLKKDLDDADVVATARGRDEVDLMQLVLNLPDPSTPNTKVKLRLVAGNVKFWKSSTKGGANNEFKLTKTVQEATLVKYEEIPVEQFTNGKFILWVEIRQPSPSFRNIVIQEEYQGVKDTVKATGIWIQRSNFRNGTLGNKTWPSNLKKDTVGNTVEVFQPETYTVGQDVWMVDDDGEEPSPAKIIAINQGVITLDFLSRPYIKNKNGRIEYRQDKNHLSVFADGNDIRQLFNSLDTVLGAPDIPAEVFANTMETEFTVQPKGLLDNPNDRTRGGGIVVLDITRQVEFKQWTQAFGGGHFIETLNTAFPNKDEQPNDDTGLPNTPQRDEDNVPRQDRIYSMDAPGFEDNSAFAGRVVYRINAYEFVRVRFDNKPFTHPLPNDEGFPNSPVEGSRCSPKETWHSRMDLTAEPLNEQGKWKRTPGVLQIENQIAPNHIPIGNPPEPGVAPNP